MPRLFATCLLLVCGSILVSSSARADQPAATDKLFDPDHLVDVRIEVDEEAWDEIRVQTRSIFKSLQSDPPKSPFTYVKADVTIDGVLIKNVGIRKKGFLGSLDDIRPSLKIKFDEYVDQAPFGDMDRLTLNNNKQDPSRLSQYLSYKMFNESGTIASRCNFAKVTVNGRHLGIYSNVESVKPAMLKRRFGDGSGMLFEGTLADFFPDFVHKFEHKRDECDVVALRQIAEILSQEEIDLEKLDEKLDVDAFLRFWATESLIGFWDGYTNNQNNFFVYQNPADSKHYFLPWGTDSAFTYFIPPVIPKLKTKSVHFQSVLANRLYHDSRTRARYRATLDELLETTWNEERLIADVDRVEKLLENDLHKDNAKEFAGAVAKVRSFITGRRSTLQKELNGWPIALRTGPREPAHTEKLGHGTAVFSTQWYDRTPSKPETRGKAEVEVFYDDELVVFKQMGATAEPTQDRSQPKVDGKRPPTVVFSGIRESDGKRITMALGTGVASFRPSEEPVGMLGIWIEGNPLLFMAKMMLDPTNVTLLDGTATFAKAGMEEGDPVEGRVEWTIMRFSGGSAPKVRWQAN